MRRIDLLYEKYNDYTCKEVKETMLNRCVTGYIKGAIVPVPCNIECEKCWNQEFKVAYYC
jgi:hypothetical protein